MANEQQALKPLEGKWFHEVSSLWPGQAFSLEAEEVLFQGKSKFQDVIVFQSKNYGRVLVLDGAIQLTERDQFSYQEMIAHTPMMTHPNPKRVLVIGGGDGAVISQLIKYKDVEEIVLCEIDEVVIEKSKEFFPQFLVGWNDKRVSVVVRDGFEYLKEMEGHFDVIMVDSSDPNEGPAETLFSLEFFTLLRNALSDEGVICTQAECMWLHLKFIAKLLGQARTLFPQVGYSYTTIPTYPSGQIGYCVATKSEKVKLGEVTRSLEDAMGAENAASLQYYSTEMHHASFVVPPFAKKELGL
eukprot:CAMPEP_0201520492 /NCGR_PEP_ID=MMETSP0161_2-20130828/11555_1 /ASSEMBLY_ACC=CAM_ASM_000251 /TAXON_ID=180227 /ORGANISM="Neoparamoeba aestuarina, Strain SoJaBio B1-5/56/2" /LENGTH=298 /DNA_ID=CAMNT_0047918881 /DNA_START=52 /DNA_END=948 /DNA_ORIENTATION=-